MPPMPNRLTYISIVCTFCVLFFYQLHAQQAPQYSLYLLNPYVYNPAYAGMEGTLVANVAYRRQWTNLLGAPETQHFNIHLPLSAISSGLGLRLENDGIGAHRVLTGVLSYNYQIQFGRNAVLSMGVSGGYMQYRLEGDKLRAPQGQYASPANFQHNDAILPEGDVQAGIPLVEAGLYFQYNRFQTGLSVQPVYAPVLEKTGAQPLRFLPDQAYLFYATYLIELNDNFSLRPSLLTKTDFAQTQVEISLPARLRESILVGLSYRGLGPRAQDAAIVMFGIRLSDKADLTYSYDAPLSALNAVNRGSHELLLRYSLNKPVGAGKLPPVIYNPRFF